MTLYRKLFEKAISTPEEVTPEGDKQIFDAGFENEADLNQIEAEVGNVEIPPEQIQQIVAKANQYSEIILNNILPKLKNIQTEFVTGAFSKLGMDVKMKDFSDTLEQLGKLSQAIPSRVNQAIIEKNQKASKG